MHHLYRHFDKKGVLLYVGVSVNALIRLNQHKHTSSWFADIASVTIENHLSREAVLIAEKKAVVEEKPLYNIRMKNQATDEGGSDEIVDTNADTSRRELVRTVVKYAPLYSMRELSELLGLSAAALRKLMSDGVLGYVELLAVTKKHTYCTGWQVISFIEWLENKDKDDEPD